MGYQNNHGMGPVCGQICLYVHFFEAPTSNPSFRWRSGTDEVLQKWPYLACGLNAWRVGNIPNVDESSNP
jgi:hypothetical protein